MKFPKGRIRGSVKLYNQPVTGNKDILKKIRINLAARSESKIPRKITKN
jgi:hypothetical protein